MINDNYQSKLDKERSFYDEFKKADYLFLDDLGTEPDKFKDYGVDYTPIPELIYERYEKQRVTVISTNLSDSMLMSRYGKRVIDRKRQPRMTDGSKPLPSQLARNTNVGQFARRLVQQWLLNARKLALI